MTTYVVNAVRGGRHFDLWELHIEGVGVTQVRRLADAEAMVRDYLECLDKPTGDATIVIRATAAGA